MGRDNHHQPPHLNLSLSPAAPLDAEPALYRGLGVTALVRLMAVSAAAWLVPSALVATLVADGIAVLMVMLSMLVIATAITTFAAASAWRRLERNRPYNWINRSLISRIPSALAGDLVRHNDLWTL